MISINRRDCLALCAAAALLQPALAQTFDHNHTAWSRLLGQHVVLLRKGQASELRYAGFAAQRDDLRRYLAALSAVSPAEFGGFTKAQQMAFLINAYNAFTVELILTRYPKLKSIKELGSFLSSPWKQRWVALLGDTVSLDDIEHNMLRKRGVYDDPRIHFAVNCASIGCPMLREQAYVAPLLERQLAEQTQRFLADRSRNRWNAQAGRLELSQIFDWYGDDFRQGHQGIQSLQGLAAQWADVLADDEATRARIRAGQIDISYLKYDWRLNDVASAA